LVLVMSYFRSSTIELGKIMRKSQMFGSEFFEIEKNFGRCLFLLKYSFLEGIFSKNIFN
jgi:hypothetical protein